MKKVVKFECDICSELYTLAESAIKCEKRHRLTEKLIPEFIEKIKIKYPDIDIQWEYYKRENQYDISHNYIYEDIKFSSYVGELIKEMFFNNRIFNVCFAYDYNKYKF